MVNRFQLMCDDLESARLNRERQERGDTDPYYTYQAHAVEGWRFGMPAPQSVRVGELPYVGKIRRIPREEE